MRTAIDTNILSSLWSNEPPAVRMAAQLPTAKREGDLVVCGAVYAELLAFPGAFGEFVERFLSDTGIAVDFTFEKDLWRDAAYRFARYAARRRASHGGSAKRPLADFLVGTHALRRADRLLTADISRYRLDFPQLNLLSV